MVKDPITSLSLPNVHDKQNLLSHITTRFVRLDMKRGPYFGVVYPVSHPACRIKDSNPNDMSLNSVEVACIMMLHRHATTMIPEVSERALQICCRISRSSKLACFLR
jgi:hypothetical protein